MGHINVAPTSLGNPAEWEAEQTVDSILKVLIHEAMHVLGFTYEKIQQFPCPDKPSFDRFEPGSAAIRSCSAAGSANPIEERSHMSNGVLHTERRVLTPKVLQMARGHYNCPQTANQLSANNPFSCNQDPFETCMDGVPIENSGGEGTEASHWEKRVMNGELMIGAVQSTQITAISSMTLALFEDSGWYVADYQVLGPRCFYQSEWCSSPKAGSVPREPLLWGQGRGCGFVSGRCNQNAWKAPGYFCEDAEEESSEGCTLGRRALGFCTLARGEMNVPAEFRYFADPKLGGKELEDYCPIWQAYNDWDCRFAPGDPARAAVIASSTANKGEQRCEECRCFRSSLFNSSSRYMTEEYYGCYEHRCVSSTQLQLRIADLWHDCNSHNNRIHIDGWTGFVPCPNATEMCEEAEDLGWPSLLSVVPRTGSHLGGTALTLSGFKLVDRLSNGSVVLPQVDVCGVQAAGAVLISSAGNVETLRVTTAPQPEQNISCKAAEGGAARLSTRVNLDHHRRLFLVVAARTDGSCLSHVRCICIPGGAEPLISGNLSCHVRLIKEGGRYGQAFSAFTYVNPSPAQRPIDISCGWSTDVAVRIAMRIWPYAMTVIVVLFTLHLMHEVGTRKWMIHRVSRARLRAASVVATEHAANRAL
mmetsp:Transcript_22407/g.50613  ORF Transcript_22407/g.50613 Transcript_22407/m.50613 type:complete len:646 (-) Transcript_22407:338-2275(-)|eukprot:CAMPEP_0181227530 /NCGR_PEP_ID=MMETSP1096-20121128/32838_1 /TAXON_ID=156174 ORGANISM="Chrysochromulina ericina, Strain CCMP281" /NCGR_SAMPLE_ID=MMETSP1096 /ASSEMBLY_ACC=CAM_ASM_000453 /LENGTH=645 /DNA_ID=CAMNT_0023320943 /DNA_START=328 /DNA_END=2265 /DNA_ORIENTATION=+